MQIFLLICLGLIEILTHLGVGVAEVVQRIGVRRVQGDDPPHGFDGGLFVLLLVVHDAQPEEKVGVVRGLLGCLREGGQGLVVAPGLFVNRAEIIVQFRVGRVALNRGFQLLQRLVGFALLLQDKGDVNDRILVEARFRRHPAEALEGLGVLFQTEQGEPLQVVQIGAFGYGLQHAADQVERIVRLLRLDVALDEIQDDVELLAAAFAKPQESSLGVGTLPGPPVEKRQLQ